MYLEEAAKPQAVEGQSKIPVRVRGQSLKSPIPMLDSEMPNQWQLWCADMETVPSAHDAGECMVVAVLLIVPAKYLQAFTHWSRLNKTESCHEGIWKLVTPVHTLVGALSPSASQP